MRPAERISSRKDRALYQQVADDLRHLIKAGTLPPGRNLPGEADLADDYDVSVNTIRGALAVLRGEGLIVTERAKGSHVRTPQEPLVVVLPPTGWVEIRLATDAERISLDLPPAAAVVEIHEEISDGEEVREVTRVVPALGTIIQGEAAT
jgi:DNA-binding GntR family transcriptional regulator